MADRSNPVDIHGPSGRDPEKLLVILVPGTEAREVYRNLAARLVSEVHCDVLCPQLLGFRGRPEELFALTYEQIYQALLREILEFAAQRQVVVVGDSWGGPLTARLVNDPALSEAQIKVLGWVCLAGSFSHHHPWLNLAMQSAPLARLYALMGYLLRALRLRQRDSWLKARRAASTFTELSCAVTHPAFYSWLPAGFLPEFVKGCRRGKQEFLRGLKCDHMLLLEGEFDVVVQRLPIEMSTRALQLHPPSDWMVVTYSGHHLLLDHAATRVEAEILQFVVRLEVRPRV